MQQEISSAAIREQVGLHRAALGGLPATGEMADLTRSFDWGATRLGPISTWGEALLVTVNMLLANRQPMFLFWGDERLQFYNDAYRPSLGLDKHPSALGQHGELCWTEIWDVIGPQIEVSAGRGSNTAHAGVGCASASGAATVAVARIVVPLRRCGCARV